MKFFIKGIIGLFVINSLLGNLKQEGIISGRVVINYPKLIKKLGDNICIEFKNSDNEGQYRDRFENFSFNHHQDNASFQRNPDYEGESSHIRGNNYHILQHGETLITLSSKYGVPWREIQEVNRIRNARTIRPGQRILIPTQFTSDWNS